MYGFLPLPWWGYIVVMLVFTQLTIFSVTLYLHRCQAHRALELHPIVSHFFRFWLWLTTGTVTKEWAAIHRKHHAKVESGEDPHSPVSKGIFKVLFEGAELYRKEAANQETLDRYGEGTPDDWIERHVYSGSNYAGIYLMLLIDIALFGTIGITMWAIQMAWIPFFAAGVINGVGHYLGYRNYECKDASRNIIPIGFFLGGEELHNNHHAYATSAKFATKWWEFDAGWMVIRGLQALGLAKPKRTVPKMLVEPTKTSIDADTIKALLKFRMQVMATYAREVVIPTLREERQKASDKGRAMLRRAKSALIREESLMGPKQQTRLQVILDNFQSLNTTYEFRQRLQDIWNQRQASQKELMDALQEWCQQAEATGLEALERFSMRLRQLVPQEATAAV